jgi:prepilin-type N-terminal cleavage/methylation domain-containing protein
MTVIGRSQAGFSLVEMLMVVAVASVCLAVALAVNPQVLRMVKADAGLQQVLETIRAARETAISQRRNVQVRFQGTNIIQIAREDIDAAGNVAGTTVLRTVQLENRMRFMLVPNVPDTPERFGRTAEIAFPSTTRNFTSEGTFVGNTGDPMNGTVFLAVPDDPSSARAVTFFGATALVRVWRWDGRKWTE